ncbi:MAG: DNA gyrase subunit B, partial [Campylobacterales bacterium]
MEYSAKNIKVLKGLEAVRKRPGMYIGDTSRKGLHHLIFEVVDNSIDEAMAGYADRIEVVLKKDGSVVIADNGRGIPVDIHPEEGKPAATLVLTTLHAGGKFDSKTYKVSGGLHGVGVSVVNALSKKLIMEIHRGGKVYRQEFSRGAEVTPLEEVGETDKRGTIIQFYPDPEIFEETRFQKEIVGKRLKELAYLNPGVEILLTDERDGSRERYFFEGGIRDFLEELVDGEPISNLCYFRGEGEERGKRFEVEVAFKYTNRFDERILSYVNNIRTEEGGSHEVGFKSGLTRAIINYINQNFNLRDLKVVGEDVREGLRAIINLKLSEPQFEGQTKTKLGDSFIRPALQRITYDHTSRFLEENPRSGKNIGEKGITSAKSRIAAQKARELIRKQAKLGGATLPGKLSECQSSDPRERELYLVEGDSAGGSAKQGRDRRFQAILPLRGKILNTQKAGELKLLESEEIKNIITALGTGIGEDFDIAKLRYHKIIIMTDADVDGSHIQTLIMTFFFNYLRELIEQGHLYIAQPPLYRYKRGKREVYLKNDQELNRLLIKEGAKGIDLPFPPEKTSEVLEKVALYRLYLRRLGKIFGVVDVIRFFLEGGREEELEQFLTRQGYRL